MKKIDNSLGSGIEIPIMTTANLCVENQRQLRRFSPRNIKIYVVFFLVTIILAIFGNPILALANLSSLATVLVSANTFRMSARGALKSMCKNMAMMAGGYLGVFHEYSDDVEVDIVPKNMQIDVNLDALNIVPILKEGKYVIIKSYDYPVFIRVFEEDGKEESYAMEAIDEDIEVLENELPEYQEYIDVLKLQKKPPFLP